MNTYADTDIEGNLSTDLPGGDYILKSAVDAGRNSFLDQTNRMFANAQMKNLKQNEMKTWISDGWSTFEFNPLEDRTPEEHAKLDKMKEKGYQVFQGTEDQVKGIVPQLRDMQKQKQKMQSIGVDLLSYGQSLGWRNTGSKWYDISTFWGDDYTLPTKQVKENTKGVRDLLQQVVSPGLSGDIMYPPGYLYNIIKGLNDDIEQGKRFFNADAKIVVKDRKGKKKTMTVKEAIKDMMATPAYQNLFTQEQQQAEQGQWGLELERTMQKEAAKEGGKINWKEILGH